MKHESELLRPKQSSNGLQGVYNFLMSKQVLNNYYNQLDETIRYGKSRNEGSVSIPFFNLVNAYAEKRNLRLVHQRDINGLQGRKVRPDGVLTNAMNLEFGIWESKDEKDDIRKEIKAKIAKGYPLTNTLFEDTNTAILFQNGSQAALADMKDPDALDSVLNAFVNFEPPQVQEFNQALLKFTEDVPTIVESLRHLIKQEADTNRKFITKRDEFLLSCQTEINPEITLEDVREMMIQHILTADIFTNVFADAEFLRQNTNSATAPPSNGFSTSTKRRNHPTRPSPKSSTPTASLTTKRRSLTCSSASARSASKRWRLSIKCRKKFDDKTVKRAVAGDD